jgi:hypothetical protein
MHYADLENLIKDYLPEASKPAEKESVGRILDAVSAFVDSYTKRPAGFFNPSPADPTMKRIRGEGERFLRLPVHVKGTTEAPITVENVSSTLFYESDGKSWLYFEDSTFGFDDDFDCCSSRIWQNGRAYKVTARWGYAATPADLSEAVRQIVVRWYETQKGTLGQITPNGFVVERDVPKSAKAILDSYKKREFEI